jgi:hypothetical protein
VETKIKLNPSEELVQDKHRSKGTMAQTDIYHYSIVNEAGEIVGKVVHEDHTSLNGLRRTQHITQTDNDGNLVVQESW